MTPAPSSARRSAARSGRPRGRCARATPAPAPRPAVDRRRAPPASSDAGVPGSRCTAQLASASAERLLRPLAQLELEARRLALVAHVAAPPRGGEARRQHRGVAARGRDRRAAARPARGAAAAVVAASSASSAAHLRRPSAVEQQVGKGAERRKASSGSSARAARKWRSAATASPSCDRELGHASSSAQARDRRRGAARRCRGTARAAGSPPRPRPPAPSRRGAGLGRPCRRGRRARGRPGSSQRVCRLALHAEDRGLRSSRPAGRSGARASARSRSASAAAKSWRCWRSVARRIRTGSGGSASVPPGRERGLGIAVVARILACVRPSAQVALGERAARCARSPRVAAQAPRAARRSRSVAGAGQALQHRVVEPARTARAHRIGRAAARGSRSAAAIGPRRPAAAPVHGAAGPTSAWSVDRAVAAGAAGLARIDVAAVAAVLAPGRRTGRLARSGVSSTLTPSPSRLLGATLKPVDQHAADHHPQHDVGDVVERPAAVREARGIAAEQAEAAGASRTASAARRH